MTHCHSFIKSLLVLLLCLGGGVEAFSQALLPNISVYNKNGQTYITWTSGYTGIKQIGVQRSQDSIYNYATIGHVSQPNKKVNEYIDTKAPAGKNYYRLFILLSNNSYFFSNPSIVTLQPATLQDSPKTAIRNQAFQPSIYVYTNADGNVNISLAHAPAEKYDIRFYDDKDHFLFSLKDIKKPFLILDKSNFLQAGWYHFELFENGKVREKWKFYIGDPK